MAEPLIFTGVFYPKNKKDPPMAGTFIGNQSSGPGQPPPDINPSPPLVIWGGPIDPYPDHGLPEPPPEKPPAAPEKPHEGWNWSAAKSQWYYLYVPGSGDAQPKK